MSRTLLIGLIGAAMLAGGGRGAMSEPVARYHMENAWPSKSTGQSKGKGLKGKTTTRKKVKSK